jgi:HD-like signal output (HDOD) protein
MSRLPPFSPILTKLMATLSKEDVMVGQLADWIEKDSVLTGNVMRMVNSAAYGRSGRVSSVRHAITILGTARLRNIVLSLSVCKMMEQVKLPNGWSAKEFNLHGVAVANMADILAQYAAIEYGEGAFVAGLLHDVGKLLFAVVCPEAYSAILATVREGKSFYDAESAVFGFTHADLSHAVVERWKLPEPIQVATRFHHSPDAKLAGGTGLTLARAVHIADGVVNTLGISCLNANETPRDPLPLLESIVGSSKVDRVLKAFYQELDAMKATL